MAAENAAEQGQTAGEYIVHHLTHFQSSKPGGVADFTVFNFDFFPLVAELTDRIDRQYREEQPLLWIVNHVSSYFTLARY